MNVVHLIENEIKFDFKTKPQKFLGIFKADMTLLQAIGTGIISIIYASCYVILYNTGKI
jgi:hypothetical protein